jgi:glycosyltransferase involved in cell wall biosynthesis
MLCDVDFSFPDATRTHTVEVARGFALAGYDVDLVARGPDQQVDGVRYSPARGDDEQRLARLVTLNLRTIGLLWRRRRSARCFYLREKWVCAPATIVARVLGYSIVMQVDSIGFGPGQTVGFGWIKRLITALMGRLSHGVLAVTPELKQLLIGSMWVPADRVAVIANGVDVDFFAPMSRADAIAKLGLDPRCSYVIFCGGFHEWSDFDTLLEAFALVVAARPQARLLMVGDGPERELVRRRTRELELEDVVVMTGFVHDRTTVRDYLAAATVAVLPYRAELVKRTSASPVKLNEYLASGRAVVAVDITGVRNLVEDSGAGLVVAGTAHEFSTAILRLLDPAEADRYGAAGRRLAESRLSWRSVIERTLQLFPS